jgi:AraC family transcriptional regulator
MTNKDVILNSVRYVEANLENDISVLDIAKEACYSLYHFIRLFQSITGYSPKSYLQLRRLTEAALNLRGTDTKISDLAYTYQFGSPEAFTRAFRKQFNIKPSDIRKGQSLVQLPLVQALNADYIYQSDKARELPPQLIELPEIKLAGLSFFVGDEDQIEDLSKEWMRLLKEVGTIENRVIPERFYQCQYWSDMQELGGLYFFTGVEVQDAAGLNPLFVAKTIPAGKYLRFIHKGLSNRVGYTYKYIYNQYLPDTDYRLSKPFNFEFYGPKHKGPYNEDSESEIFIPVE